MAKRKTKSKNLIITGRLEAECACGGWKFQGISAGARKEIEQIYESHRWSCTLK